MKRKEVRMRNRKKIILAVIAVLSLNLAFVFSQTVFPQWLVPEDAKALENPVEADKKTIAAGETFYKINCASCHGEKGLGDGIIPSANLSTIEFQQQSDGAIFYKLQEGRGQMPSFKIQNEDDLWKVVLYLRTLMEDTTTQKILKNALIDLSFTDSTEKKFITAIVNQIIDSIPAGPAVDIRAGIYVKRYFGLLPLSEPNTYTDTAGQIIVECPLDIPGDSLGNLIIVGKIEDGDYEETEMEKTIGWGLVSDAHNADYPRELWAPLKYTPYWLFGLFFGIAGAVWLTIFYVFLQIRKIRQLSKK